MHDKDACMSRREPIVCASAWRVVSPILYARLERVQ